MANWVLTQKTAGTGGVNGGVAGNVTGTLPVASTAGTLLIACLTSNDGAGNFTGPAGWIRGPQDGQGTVSNGTSRAEIWYYPDNPGGISSAEFFSGQSNTTCRCELMEFTPPSSPAAVALSASGANVAGSTGGVTSLTVTAGAATQADALSVVVFQSDQSSAASGTWTSPSGITQAAAATGSIANQFYAGYGLTTAAGTASFTGTFSVSNTNANGWAGAAAVFNIVAADAETGTGGGAATVYVTSGDAGTGVDTAKAAVTSAETGSSAEAVKAGPRAGDTGSGTDTAGSPHVAAAETGHGADAGGRDWSLVQKTTGGPINGGPSGTVTGTLPVASTAGTLLVACLTSNDGASAFTGPAGWIQGPQIGQGTQTNQTSRAEIWYYPDNPGGISSGVFTSGASNTTCRCELLEFVTAATGLGGVTLTASGGNVAGSTSGLTSLTVTADAPNLGNALAVVVYLSSLTSGSAATWTDPAGITKAASAGGTIADQYYSGYDLAAPGGTQSLTGTLSVANTNPYGWAGAVAVFDITVTSADTATGADAGAVTKAYIASGDTVGESNATAALFGATIHPNTAGSPPQNATTATQTWNALVGAPAAGRKIYHNPRSFPSSGTTFQEYQYIQACITLGMRAYLCYSPYAPLSNPPSSADLTQMAIDETAMMASIAYYQTLGLNDFKVILYQEVTGAGSGLNAYQYQQVVTYYQAAVRAVCELVYDGSASAGEQGYSTGLEGLLDVVGADLYCSGWSGGLGTADFSGFEAVADSFGVPFGIFEFGGAAGTAIPSQAQEIAFIQYVTSLIAARRGAGKPTECVLWWENNLTGLGQNVIVPGDFRIPYLYDLYQAITGAEIASVNTGAQPSGGDTGHGADTQAVTAHVPSGDTGHGTEGATVRVAGADTGHGTDAAAKVGPKPADTAAATDTAKVKAASADTSGAAVDAGRVGAASGGTGHGTEAAAAPKVEAAEHATGADSAAVHGSAADTATGADVATVHVSSGDTGVAAEVSPPVHPAAADTAHAADAATVHVSGGDTAHAVDAARVGVTAADTGHEAEAAAPVETGAADSSQPTEDAAVTIRFGPQLSGTASVSGLSGTASVE